MRTREEIDAALRASSERVVRIKMRDLEAAQKDLDALKARAEAAEARLAAIREELGGDGCEVTDGIIVIGSWVCDYAPTLAVLLTTPEATCADECPNPCGGAE